MRSAVCSFISCCRPPWTHFHNDKQHSTSQEVEGTPNRCARVYICGRVSDILLEGKQQGTTSQKAEHHFIPLHGAGSTAPGTGASCLQQAGIVLPPIPARFTACAWVGIYCSAPVTPQHGVFARLLQAFLFVMRMLCDARPSYHAVPCDKPAPAQTTGTPHPGPLVLAASLCLVVTCCALAHRHLQLQLYVDTSQPVLRRSVSAEQQQMPAKLVLATAWRKPDQIPSVSSVGGVSARQHYNPQLELQAVRNSDCLPSPIILIATILGTGLFFAARSLGRRAGKPRSATSLLPLSGERGEPDADSADWDVSTAQESAKSMLQEAWDSGQDECEMGQRGFEVGGMLLQSFDTESMATLLTMLCKERRRCSGLGILDDVEDQSYAVALLGGIMESMTGWSSTDWGTVFKMVLRKSFVYKTYQPGPGWATVGMDQKGLWLVFGSFGSTKWNRQEKDAFLMAAVDPVASRLTNWVSTVWKQVPAEWWDPMTPQGQPCQPNIMSILTMTPLLVDAKVSDNNSVQVVYEGVEVLWSHRGEDSVDMGLLGTVLGQSVVMQSFDTESMARLLTIMCKERRYGSGLGILDDVEDQSYAVALLGGIMESMTECLPAAWWDPKTPQGEPCQPNIMSILTMWALLVDAKVSDDNSVEVVYEGVEVLWSHRGEDSVDMRQLGAVLGQSVVMQSFDTESMATLLTMLCKERRRCSGLGILDDVEDQSYAVALLGGIMESMTGWSSTDWGMVLRKSFVYKTYQPGPSWAAVFLDQKGLWLVFGSFGSTKWNRQEKDAFLMAAVDPVASRLTNWVSTVWKQVPAEWWDPMTPQGQPCQPNIMSILTMTPLLVDAKVSDNNSVQVVYEGVEVLWSHRGEDSVDMGLLGTVLGQSVVMQSFDTESMARLLTIMCKERRYGSGLGILDDVEDQSYAVALLGGIMESMTECLPAAWWDPKTPQGEPCQPNIMSILTMWALLVDAKVSDDNSVEVVYEGVEVLWSHRGEDSVDMRQLGAVLGQSVVMQSFDTESMATLLTMLCKERRRCSGLGILDDVEDQSYAVALLGGIMENMTGWSSTDWGMVLRKSFVYKTYQRRTIPQSVEDQPVMLSIMPPSNATA